MAYVLQVWTFRKHQKESELGLNMRAGETITNEQLTPREVKGYSKQEEKEAVCDT